jgi:hypothetical protein
MISEFSDASDGVPGGRGVRAVIRKVTFASCYVYSPGGSNAASERSRLMRTLLKARDAHFMLKYAGRVRQQVADRSPLAGFLCPTHVLVPVPGSAPTVAGAMSVAEHLAAALIAEGLGRCIWNGLHRDRAVRKSATAARGSRPTVDTHYDSFAIDSLGVEPHVARASQVMLIDDVVTKGRTLLAAAARLQDAFPNADIRAFALLRTMGTTSGVSRLLDPCVGEIAWWAGDAHRNP